MNLKLFTTALLATGATAAWTAEDFDALSEAISNQLFVAYQKELNVQRRDHGSAVRRGFCPRSCPPSCRQRDGLSRLSLFCHHLCPPICKFTG